MGVYYDAYERWESDLEKAYVHKQNGTIALSAFGDVYVDSFADARAAMGHLGNAIQHILLSLVDLTYHPLKADHEVKLHKKWAQTIDNPPWGGDEYELTWKKIILAWDEMSKAEILYTIDYIDFMRKTIWNEPWTIKLQANPYIE